MNASIARHVAALCMKLINALLMIKKYVSQAQKKVLLYLSKRLAMSCGTEGCTIKCQKMCKSSLAESRILYCISAFDNRCSWKQFLALLYICKVSS